LHTSLLKWINTAYFLDGADEYNNTLLQESDPAVPIIQWLLDSTTPTRHTVEQTWTLNALRDNLRTQFSLQWREAGIDALLCPVNASVASAHDESKYWGYTAVFNATDLPGVVFPVTTVQETDTWDKDTKAVMGERDELYRKFWNEGGVDKYRDAPVNLQLVGRRLREENLLAVAEVVEGVFRGADMGKSRQQSKHERRDEMIQSRL